jgi:hypothetical protein
VGLRGALEKKATPPVVKLDRWRDGFDRFPKGLDGAAHLLTGERSSSKAAWGSLSMQAPMPAASFFAGPVSSPAMTMRFSDGFEAARRAPVELSGGRRPALPAAESTVAGARAGASGFTASLDDLL